MVEIDSLSDLICNIKDAMKTYFFTKQEIRDDYSPIGHSHPIDDTLKSNSTNPVQNKVIKSALDSKSDNGHKHDIVDVNSLESSLNGKSDKGHNHSIGEITSLQSTLDDKAPFIHTHPIDVTLNSTSENPVQNKVIKTALDSKSDNGHDHDDRYFTETEVTNKLAAKSDKTHNHDSSYVQIPDFNSLESKFNRRSAVRVRLIRADSNYKPHSQDTELDNEGTVLKVLNGYKLGARLYTTDSTISLNNREITLIFVTSNGWPTKIQTTTNSQGITKEMINLGNNLNGVAYAILNGTNNFYKDTDIKFVEYQSS